jgi:hypothetical protein
MAIAVVACGDDTTDDTTSGTTTGTTTTSTGGEGGDPGVGGGGGEGGGTGGQNQVLSFDQATDGFTPFDVTPSPDGETLYFTGEDPLEGPGVFEVAASGGNASALSLGDPYAAPFGIATSTDGSTLYIADPASDEAGADRGQILVLDVAGGTPTTLDGSDGLTPLGLEVIEENGADQVYFTGRGPTGQPSIFKLAAGGGTATALAEGGVINDPSGIAVASNGDVYFVDTVGSGSGLARVLFLAEGSGTPTVLADNLNVGYPAGIALDLDEAELLVSGLDPAPLTDVILRIDLTSMDVTLVSNATISGGEEAAGIHRAKNANVWGFADSKAGGDGAVYTISK